MISEEPLRRGGEFEGVVPVVALPGLAEGYGLEAYSSGD